MEELRENLGLPNIGGQIIAYTGKLYNRVTRQIAQKVFWRIDIILPGPDSRYNPGKASFDGSARLLSTFEKAYQKMRLLEKESFPGEYSNIIDDYSTAKFEVKAANGQIYMLFWVKSDTFMF